MAYEESNDLKIKKISYLIQDYIQTKEASFIIQGQDVFPQEIGWHLGALPLFLNKSKKVFDEAFNSKSKTRDFPIQFYENENAFFEIEPKFGKQLDNDGSFIVLAHILHYTVDEYLNYYLSNKALLVDGKIPLDSLYEEWVASVNHGFIEVKKPEIKPSSSGGGR